MSTPDKKKHYAFCFFNYYYYCYCHGDVAALKVDWFYDLIACVAHGEQPSEQCLHTRSHNSTSTKGKKIMSLYCCWTIVILIDTYMTFETRCVEAHCLLTGTSQRQLLNVTLRDVWNDANCWPTHWSDRLLVYPCIYRSTNDFIVLWLRMWFLFSSVL